MSVVERIPVTVIGGYLGAGKTTLLNHLLAQANGRRLALLVNDFAAINIDAELVSAHDGDTVRLNNGCVCCTIAGDLGRALQAQSEARPVPERIIIEASGVADPGKVALSVMGWPGLKLDAIVTIVDAETVQARAQDKYVGHLVSQQLRAGDLVVVNKLDKVEADKHNDVLAWARDRAAGANVLSSRYAQVDPSRLFEIADHETYFDAVQSEGQPVAHGHTDQFTSCVYTSATPISLEKLKACLRSFSSQLIRAKGYVYSSQEPTRRLELQLVDGDFTFVDGRRWGSAVADTKLVFIGLKSQLQSDSLLRTLEAGTSSGGNPH